SAGGGFLDRIAAASGGEKWTRGQADRMVRNALRFQGGDTGTALRGDSPSAGGEPQSLSLRRWGIGALLLTIVLCIAGWCAVALLCLCVGSSGGFGWPRDAFSLRYRSEVVLLASLVG